LGAACRSSADLDGRLVYLSKQGLQNARAKDRRKWSFGSKLGVQLPKGVQLAVLTGDPSKAGPYTIRLKWPIGSNIGPHWHPADVNVTVVSGIFEIAVGDNFDKSEGKLVKPGGFFLEPKGMHHYAWTEGTTVIQLHGEGPLVINYVNSSDDPSTTHH
jgi:hypothetical protein